MAGPHLTFGGPSHEATACLPLPPPPLLMPLLTCAVRDLWYPEGLLTGIPRSRAPPGPPPPVASTVQVPPSRVMLRAQRTRLPLSPPRRPPVSLPNKCVLGAFCLRAWRAWACVCRVCRPDGGCICMGVGGQPAGPVARPEADGWWFGGGGTPMPYSAQPQHTNDWAPRTRKRHQREHRPQRPTERSDPTRHAKGGRGDCPGPRKGATTRWNVTRGGGGGCSCRSDHRI